MKKSRFFLGTGQKEEERIAAETIGEKIDAFFFRDKILVRAQMKKADIRLQELSKAHVGLFAPKHGRIGDLYRNAAFIKRFEQKRKQGVLLHASSSFAAEIGCDTELS